MPQDSIVVCVEHGNGVRIEGLITDGDAHGIFVQQPNHPPVYCAWVNVLRVERKF